MNSSHEVIGPAYIKTRPYIDRDLHCRISHGKHRFSNMELSTAYNENDNSKLDLKEWVACLAR